MSMLWKSGCLVFMETANSNGLAAANSADLDGRSVRVLPPAVRGSCTANRRLDYVDMRSLVILAFVGSCGGGSASRYITIDTDSIGTAIAFADHGARVVDEAGDVAILEVDSRDLDALSPAMHDQHHRCGG